MLRSGHVLVACKLMVMCNTTLSLHIMIPTGYTYVASYTLDMYSWPS